MTEDELALLRMIREHPDADLPRLVYADWLEERGQEARAEFIRLQIDRYRRIPTDTSAKGISWREYQLLEQHELAWKAELPPGFRTGAAFRRGLIHRVGCRIAYLIDATEDDLAAPIETLSVAIDEVRIEWLDATPAAFRLPLRELSIHCREPVGPILAETLIRLGPYPRLRTLRIYDPVFGCALVQTLPPSPAYPGVTHLDLSGCELTGRSVLSLGESGWMDRLEKLSLGHMPGRTQAVRDAVAWLRLHYPKVRID